MKDIENRDDIERLVNEFYRKICEDDLLGFIFTDIVKINGDKHLQVMYNFWDNIILFSGTYTGNPMDLYKSVHNSQPINSEHFSRWVQLFIDTVDRLYEGENAELAKQRTKSISSIIEKKIIAQNKC